MSMRRSESDATSDGFDWAANSSDTITTTRRERLRDVYEERISKPLLVARDDWRTSIGFGVLSVYLLMAAIAILGLWRKPSTSQAPRYLVPFENLNYPLGTTQAGIDLLALVIHSTPEMIVMVTAGGVWATGIALLVGTISGYKGGLIDRGLMAFSDFFMAIPGLPLVVILAFTFSPHNPVFVGVIITINYWAGLGRAIRSQVLTIRENSYVEASRTMGVSNWRIIKDDVVPNLMPYVSISFVFAARYVVFASVGLYFLGVLPITEQNWGVTLNFAYHSGAMFALSAVHWLIVPMVAIGGLSLSFVLIGQGLDRVFNPRVRTRLSGESESTNPEEGEDSTVGGQIV